MAETDGIRLLLVEDDRRLVAALERGLRHEGYTIDAAYTGEEALAKATSGEYAAVVLDVMLPGADGFEVCEELRRERDWVPVLMLTARADVADRIRGLDAGADDYLVKPFDFGELLARLRALTRRGAPERGGASGELAFDTATRTVTYADREVELTAREFEVLEALARHEGEVVTRSQLLDEVWQDGYDGSPNVVDVYVGYLRRKLNDPELIRTVRGVGFVLEAR